jgi:hypothetical protein
VASPDVEPSEVVSVDVESLGGVGSAITPVGSLADVVGDALDVGVGDAVGGRGSPSIPRSATVSLWARPSTRRPEPLSPSPSAMPWTAPWSPSPGQRSL